MSVLETIANFIAYNLWIPWVLIGVAIFILFLATKQK